MTLYSLNYEWDFKNQIKIFLLLYIYTQSHTDFNNWSFEVCTSVFLIYKQTFIIHEELLDYLISITFLENIFMSRNFVCYISIFLIKAPEYINK